MILRRIFFIALMLLSFLVIFITVVKASEVKVDQVAGKFEKLKEKVTLLFKIGRASKTDYLQYLTDKRLAELTFVIGAKQIDDVEPTASRYSTYLGNLTNFVIEKRVTEKKDNLLAMFDRHEEVVGQLQKNFEFESGWWIAIQHDINSIKIFREKLSSLK